MEEYKKIATIKLIEIVGQEWLQKNTDNISTFIYEDGLIIRIVFCLISSLPSEEEIVNNINPDFQPQGSISFDINKVTKECELHKNLL